LSLSLPKASQAARLTVRDAKRTDAWLGPQTLSPSSFNHPSVQHQAPTP